MTLILEGEIFNARRNINATTSPTTADNLSKRWSVGSLWINLTTKQMFINMASDLTTATWKEFTGTTLLTTKGDVLTHNGTIEVRLPVGTNGQVIKANSAVANGIEWGAAVAAINDITDVTITTPADNEVLGFDTLTSEWINQTAAEAGLSVTGHTHTESEISDLGTAIALVADKLDVFAATTSAELAGVVSDETGSGALVFATSPTLVTPALGTPASGVATNLTGTASGLTAGNVTTNANLTGHVTSVGNAAVLGSFTSLQLKTALTNETGSGAAVFATSPTLVTPALGTPASGVMTNVTGTASGLTAGNVTTNANLTGPVTSVGNATTITNGAVTIPMLANGTDGEIITWDTSGVATTVPVGTNNDVLTSNGAGNEPTFQSPAAIANLTDITDVVITTPADNELLGFDSVSGNWINQTAAEAGLSVTGHAHTESDISDLGTAIALVADKLDVFAATTSAELAGVISDESGTGLLVFNDSPALVTPALGTPASGVMTNVTGTASGLTSGNVTTNANLTGPVTSVGNATTIVAKAVTVAMLADGTDGELITWDTNGVATVVAVGTVGQVLTSGGAGVEPTFQTGAAGPTVLQDVLQSQVFS